MMTTLPSFVELMSTLGIDPITRLPVQPSARTSPSSPLLLAVPTLSPARSKSIPSLREHAIPRSRGARYSPYAPTFLTARRGSVSSSSSSSPELERMSLRAYSTSPVSSSPRLHRRVNTKHSVNVFDSSSDLSANTPISSFVRRKTPGVSPTSPTFSFDSRSTSPMPFTLPTLPSFLPQSASSDSFPVTPNSDINIGDLSPQNSPACKSTLLPEVSEGGYLERPRRTGIRISAPTESIKKATRIAA